MTTRSTWMYTPLVTSTHNEHRLNTQWTQTKHTMKWTLSGWLGSEAQTPAKFSHSIICHIKTTGMVRVKQKFRKRGLESSTTSESKGTSIQEQTTHPETTTGDTTRDESKTAAYNYKIAHTTGAAEQISALCSVSLPHMQFCVQQLVSLMKAESIFAKLKFCQLVLFSKSTNKTYCRY